MIHCSGCQLLCLTQWRAMQSAQLSAVCGMKNWVQVLKWQCSWDMFFLPSFSGITISNSIPKFLLEWNRSQFIDSIEASRHGNSATKAVAEGTEEAGGNTCLFALYQHSHWQCPYVAQGWDLGVLFAVCLFRCCLVALLLLPIIILRAVNTFVLCHQCYPSF